MSFAGGIAVVGGVVPVHILKIMSVELFKRISWEKEECAEKTARHLRFTISCRAEAGAQDVRQMFRKGCGRKVQRSGGPVGARSEGR